MDEHDWRDTLDEMDADAASHRIARAPVIPGVTSLDGVSMGWKRPEILTLVDLYLEGDVGQHAVGVATLLDWFSEARALGHDSGAWLGRLEEARELLLGVVERGWGVPGAVARERLASMRSGGPRDPAPSPPSQPLQARHTSGFPNSPGRQLLGDFAVGNSVTILEGGFPGGSQGPIDDLTVAVGTRTGRWRAYLVREDSPSALSAHTFNEEVDDCFSWLLLAHESVDPRVSVPDELIPEVGEWAGKLSIIFGDPTPRQVQSIRYASDAYVVLWEWGITWNRPRCGVPVALGGSEGARDWIGIVDTVSA